MSAMSNLAVILNSKDRCKVSDILQSAQLLYDCEPELPSNWSMGKTAEVLAEMLDRCHRLGWWMTMHYMIKRGFPISMTLTVVRLSWEALPPGRSYLGMMLQYKLRQFN